MGEGDCERVDEAEGVSDCEGLCDFVCERVPVGVPLADRVWVCVPDGVSLCDGVRDSEAVSVGETEGVAESEGVKVGVMVLEGVLDDVSDCERDCDPVVDADCDELDDDVRVRVDDIDGVPDCEGDGLEEDVRVRVDDIDRVPVCDGDAEFEAVDVINWEGVSVWLGVFVTPLAIGSAVASHLPFNALWPQIFTTPRHSPQTACSSVIATG